MMLVLTRKKLESIKIGDDIEVVVLEVGRNRVRLGFRCPSHIAIRRQELDLEFEMEAEVQVTEGELVCA